MKRLTALGRRLAWRRLSSVVLLVAVATIGIYWHAPRSMMNLSAHTELVVVKVINAGAATLALPQAYDLNTKRCLQNVIIVPLSDTVVTYARQAGKPLSIAVNGRHKLNAAFKGSGAIEEIAESRGEAARYDVGSGKQSPKCPYLGRSVRLPLNGIAVFGELLRHMDDPASPPLLMSEAKVNVYGRAISHFFNWEIFNRGPFRASALYESQQLTLPGGTRIGRPLEAGRQQSETRVSDRGAAATWSGYIDVRLFDSGDGDAQAPIRVEAATSADRIEVFAPEGPDRRPDLGGELPADVIALSHGARLGKDPNLIWLYGIVIALGLAYVFLERISKRHDDATAEGANSTGAARLDPTTGGGPHDAAPTTADATRPRRGRRPARLRRGARRSRVSEPGKPRRPGIRIPDR